jgi:uncharacterized protein (DUF2141 family)
MKMKLACLCSAVMLLNPLMADAERLVKMRVTASLSTGDVYIYVSTERRAGNRVLIVTAESDGYFARSTRQLEGARSARVATFHFANLPPGSYSIEAEVIDADGHTRDVARSGLLLG